MRKPDPFRLPLVDWTPLAAIERVTDNGDGTETVVVVDSVPMQTSTNRFLRVRVEK